VICTLYGRGEPTSIAATSEPLSDLGRLVDTLYSSACHRRSPRPSSTHVQSLVLSLTSPLTPSAHNTPVPSLPFLSVSLRQIELQVIEAEGRYDKYRNSHRLPLRVVGLVRRVYLMVDWKLRCF
jgi:hypothetical protein